VTFGGRAFVVGRGRGRGRGRGKGVNPLEPIDKKDVPKYNLHVDPKEKLGTHIHTCSLCNRKITKLDWPDAPPKMRHPCQRCLDVDRTEISAVEQYEKHNCGLTEDGLLKRNINLDNEIEKEKEKQTKKKQTEDLNRTKLSNKLQDKTQEEIEDELKKYDEKSAKRIEKFIEKSNGQIVCLEHAKRLRRHLSLYKELVSDDVRRYGKEDLYTDIYGIIRGHIIETHCTIFRTDYAHRNTYFGHVSLYSRKYIDNVIENEEVWHYGVHVPDGLIEPVNPQYPLRSFWPANATHILLSDLCTHCQPGCEASNGFPVGIYISNILLEHFNTCIHVFSTAQWPDQEWGH
jgi:hypothetical protein